MNPRDCWYWIHSTCRNPSCSFRHPPLEGKPGTSVSPQSGASATLPSMTGVSASALVNKSRTPCYFFSQGNCTKGDRCPFMHDSALATSAEAASQLKPPKAPEGSYPSSNKHLVVLKSVASNVYKSVPSQCNEKKFSVQNDSHPVSLNASSVSVQEKSQTAKTGEQAKVGSSATANPPRIEKAAPGRKSRVSMFSDAPDDFMNLHKRHHDRQHLAQHEQERSNHIETANHRYENGCKTDARWKNESSSLENDGLDLYLRGEDGEFSPPAANRGRPSHETATQVYKGSRTHVKGRFDAIPSNYRLPCYSQHQGQKVQYESDYNGTTDYHHCAALGARMNVRVGQQMTSEGYISNIDLREHLMKRRRDDRGRISRNQSLSKRGTSDMIETPSVSQRYDNTFISKDPHGRRSLRGVDHRSIKRVRHNGGVSPDARSSRTSPIRYVGIGRSPDRAVSPNRRSGIGFSRNEVREREKDCNATKTAFVSNVRSRSPASRSVKSEYVTQDASFTGPKSLAQIKAEKKDAELDSRIGQELGDRVQYSEEDAKLTDSRRPLSASQQDSVVSTHGLKGLQAERAFVGKRERKPSLSEDFEGPKSLSMLLKEKQKMELCMNGPLGFASSKESRDVIIDSNREVEDGEVRDEEDDYIESPNGPMQEVLGVESDPISEASEEDHVQVLADIKDDMGSSEEEVGLELRQTMSGDEDDGLDDDDDDDFAKTLGGMYS